MIPLEDRRRMQKARETGEFTDFAFTCQGQTLPAHRIIVCGQSPVFRAACTGNFREASSRTYDMNAHPLEVVERMVEYLYTGDYSVPSDATLLTHATMFTLADKYNIQGLQDTSTSKYLQCLKYKHVDPNDFIRSIPNIYELPLEASKTLRGGAIIFARTELLKKVPVGDLRTTVDDLIYDHSEFARDLLYFFLRYPLVGTCRNYSCTGWAGAAPIEILQCRCAKCRKGGADADMSFGAWERLLETEAEEDGEKAKDKSEKKVRKLLGNWNL